jgi:hypothetical protein
LNRATATDALVRITDEMQLLRLTVLGILEDLN